MKRMRMKEWEENEIRGNDKQTCGKRSLN